MSEPAENLDDGLRQHDDMLNAEREFIEFFQELDRYMAIADVGMNTKRDGDKIREKVKILRGYAIPLACHISV